MSIAKHASSIAFAAMIILFLALKLPTLPSHPIWDEGVYIGMGKYIWSAGRSGLWEAARPIAKPFLLGFAWKLGANPIITSQLINIVAAIAAAIVLYAIFLKTSKKAALLAVALFIFTPFFFKWSAILTHAPAIFFVLLSLYVCAKHPFLAGIASCIAFLFRFPAGLAFPIAISLIWLGKGKARQKLGSTAACLLGFIILLIPYLIANALIYEGGTIIAALTPFILASSYQSHIHNTQPLLFYVSHFIRQNPALLLATISPFIIGFSGLGKLRKSAIILIPACTITGYFFAIPSKELRYAIAFLPFLAGLAAITIMTLCSLPKKRTFKILAFGAVTTYCIFLICSCHLSAKITETSNLIKFHRFLENESGAVLTADPVPAAFSDALFIRLYPDPANALQLYHSMKNIDYIVYSDAAFACLNATCLASKEKLFKAISRHDKIFSTKHRGLRYDIFKVSLS